MELNINSPSYFSEHYGVDDDVYRFCREVYSFFKDKEYSETLHTIGIMPSIAPKEVYDSGKWKESVQLVGNKSCAIIYIRMDFTKYYEADGMGKIEQMKEAVLKGVKKIKARGKFDFASFEKDFDEMYKMKCKGDVNKDLCMDRGSQR